VKYKVISYTYNPHPLLHTSLNDKVSKFSIREEDSDFDMIEFHVIKNIPEVGRVIISEHIQRQRAHALCDYMNKCEEALLNQHVDMGIET